MSSTITSTRSSEPLETQTLELNRPQYGKRLPPALLDEIAATDPERIFASVPKSIDLSHGYKDISYATIANAVNRCAHWLLEVLGDGSERKVFCYIGPLDLRYILLTLAAPKAGHLAFFSSHRNSLEAHVSLLNRTGCSALLLPQSPIAMTGQILEQCPMQRIQTPELDFFMDPTPAKPILFQKNWEDIKDDTFVILHTSGSTGIPKPVFITYGSYSSMDAHQLIPMLGGKPTLVDQVRGKRWFLGLPVFHAASLNWTCGIGMFAEVTCVLPPPCPLTAEVASQAFLHSNAYGALVAPSLIVDCFNNEEYCSNMLQNLELLTYVGGMLPEEVGDALCNKIKLMTLMGSCETSLFPLEMHHEPTDWPYLSVSPHFGFTHRLARDGLYDLVLVKQQEYSLFQGVFSTFPERNEYAMGDLFECHPSKENLWRFKARTDDIISFTTAEKLNPITMESTICANPLVKSAVIGGQGQFQASLLLEPREYPQTPAEEEAFIKQVWPSIAAANRDCPAHGRIMRGFVMLTSPDKPLPRAGKDTVQRHAVFKLYEAEWKSLYDRLAPTIMRPSASQASAAPSSNSSVDTAVQSTEAPRFESKAVLPEQLLAEIDAIVDRKVQWAFDRLAGALMAASRELQAQSVSKQFRSNYGDEYAAKVTSRGTDNVSATAQGRTSLRQAIHEMISENFASENVLDDSDLFQCGLDSLQVPSLLNVINNFLDESYPSVGKINSNFVYANPTIGQLIKVIP